MKPDNNNDEDGEVDNPADEVLLLLDGGGTKGAMEAQILEDMMMILTILVEAPSELLKILR